ncbi:MAG: hypothetical protein R6V62_07145 [Candidatus Fermentibacteraceae bacterium]
MSKVIGVALFMALFAACRWSGRQQDVYDSYTRMSSALEDCRWEELHDGLSRETRELLDLAAKAFTGIGMPIDNRGDLLLAEIAAGHTLFATGKNVLDISIRGNEAFLEPSGETATSIRFVHEDGEWRMDLTPQLTGILNSALQGTGATLAQFLSPATAENPPPAAGSCMLVVSNAIEDDDVYYLFVSPAVSDDWGPDVLGDIVLLPGAVCTLHVYPDTYDMMAIGATDNTYTRWGVAVSESGYDWEINRSDLVQQ